jgi:hypothetical protein
MGTDLQYIRKCRTDLIIKQIKQLKIHRQGDKNLSEREMNSSST